MTEMDVKANPLGSAPLTGLIAKYAIPSVISMLVMSAYNVTDQIFIGNVVGMLGNAATNVAFPTVTLTTGLGMLFGIGSAANFSINQGAGRTDEAKKYVTTGMLGAAIMGVIAMVLIFIFRKQIILICGATNDVYPYALEYINITSFGLGFHLFTNSMCNIIRADGSPRYSMISSVSGVLLNILLDWFFMFPLNLGIFGAGLATVFGQLLSFTLVTRYFRRFRSFDIKIKDLKIRWRYLFKSMKVGLPNFINHMIMMCTNITLNNVLTTYGALSIYGEDIPLAVSGVAAKTNTLMVAFAVGTAQGCQPIWGFNLGAKNNNRVRGAFWRAAGFAFGIGVIFFILFQTMPRQIISIFGTGNELYFEFAEKYLRTYLMLVFFQNIQPVCINFFSAIGHAKQGIVVSLSRQGMFLIPLLIILPKYMGINGVLYASPISDMMAFILSISMAIFTLRGLDKEILDV